MTENPISKLDSKKLEEVTEKVVVNLTHELGNIKLSLCSGATCAGEGTCTACTRLSDPYNTGIVLCADQGFSKRLTEHMMGESIFSEEDIEDYFTEFFNILCGQFFGEIHRMTKVAAIFQVPQFKYDKEGNEVCTDDVKQSICFVSEKNERVCVILDKN